MSAFKWSSWGFLPVSLDKKAEKQVLIAQDWKSWADKLSSDEIRDIRSFYTRSAASIFRPIDSEKRFVLKMENSSAGVVELVSEEFEIQIQELQLLILDEISLIFIHMSSEREYSSEQIAKINRTVFSWSPRTIRHRLSLWKSNDGVERTLREIMAELLTIQVDAEEHYSEDSFGHELASCILVSGNNKNSEGDLLSKLSAGIDLNNPRYELTQNEVNRLNSGQFDYWSDWQCQFNLNRLIFLDYTPSDEFSSLSFNLNQTNYYLDLFALVVYQKIMLKEFMDELVLGEKNKNEFLYQRISRFRQKYKLSTVSTYPFAERLFGYIFRQAGIESIEEKTFTELEHSHQLWVQERSETNSSITLSISLIAALLLPASSIATIFALTNEQMNSYFWGGSFIITFFTVLVILWPNFKKIINENREK